MTILVSDVAVDVVNEIIFNAEFDVDQEDCLLDSWRQLELRERELGAGGSI